MCGALEMEEVRQITEDWMNLHVPPVRSDICLELMIIVEWTSLSRGDGEFSMLQAARSPRATTPGRETVCEGDPPTICGRRRHGRRSVRPSTLDPLVLIPVQGSEDDERTGDAVEGDRLNAIVSQLALRNPYAIDPQIRFQSLVSR